MTNKWRLIILLVLGLVLIIPGRSAAQELPDDIKVFLKAISEGGGRIAPELGETVLKTLVDLFGTYELRAARYWLVGEDCLVKLVDEDNRAVVVLTLHLTQDAEKWQVSGKPLMREIRLSSKKSSRDDTGQLRHKANKLRAEILREKAMLEGVEEFLVRMKEKYASADDQRTE
jgi:hypothetical protein